jgi:hypothetical protein
LFLDCFPGYLPAGFTFSSYSLRFTGSRSTSFRPPKVYNSEAHEHVYNFNEAMRAFALIAMFENV